MPVQLDVRLTPPVSAEELNQLQDVLDYFRSRSGGKAVGRPTTAQLELDVKRAITETVSAPLLGAVADLVVRGLNTYGPDVQTRLKGSHVQGMTRSLKRFFEKTGVSPIVENRYFGEAFPQYVMSAEVARIVLELLPEYRTQP